MDADEDADDYSENALRHETMTARLKATVHYTVGKMCEAEEPKLSVKFSRHFIAALAEITYGKFGSLAIDLEQFAKHAKRATLLPDDVKLCARRSSSLSKAIADKSQELAAEAAVDRASKKRRKETAPASASTSTSTSTSTTATAGASSRRGGRKDVNDDDGEDDDEPDAESESDAGSAEEDAAKHKPKKSRAESK